MGTNMKAEDWLTNTVGPMADTKALERYASELQSKTAQNNPVEAVYAKEIEPLLRELLPHAGDVKCPKQALRRGPGGPNNFYGFGVHQDFGLYKQDMDKLMFKVPGDEDSLSYNEWCTRLEKGGNTGY